MKLSRILYLLPLLVFITACASSEEQLKNDWDGYKEDLDKLKVELKKKSDSFQANHSLSADSAFRKRVEWLTNDIRAIEIKMDTIDAKLKLMNDTESEEEKEEKEREKSNEKSQ